jgi:hypothetical protein
VIYSKLVLMLSTDDCVSMSPLLWLTTAVLGIALSLIRLQTELGQFLAKSLLLLNDLNTHGDEW